MHMTHLSWTSRRRADKAQLDLTPELPKWTAENVIIASAWRTGGIRRRSSLPYPATRLGFMSSVKLWMRIPSCLRRISKQAGFFPR